jgi:hypothetical protein
MGGSVSPARWLALALAALGAGSGCDGATEPTRDAGGEADSGADGGAGPTRDGGRTADAGSLGDAGSPTGDVAFADPELASNRPGMGWTLVTDNRWTAAWGEGWGIADNRAPGPAPRIEDDAVSAGRVAVVPVTTVDGASDEGERAILVQRYGGTEDGFEPQFPFTGWESSREVFLASVVYFPPTWVQPEVSGIKWWIPETPFDGLGWAGLGNDGSGEPRWAFSLEGGRARPPWDGRVTFDRTSEHGFDLDAATLTRGRWHKLQLYLASGDRDRIAMWVDDRLVWDSDRMAAPLTWVEDTLTFNAIQLGATWGGGIGFPAPESNDIDYARTAIWRR